MNSQIFVLPLKILFFSGINENEFRGRGRNDSTKNEEITKKSWLLFQKSNEIEEG
jgi:hypothetical protein